MGSIEPMRNECEMICKIFHVLNCGYEVFSHPQFMQYMKYFIYHFTMCNLYVLH